MNKSLIPNAFTSANLLLGVLCITFASEGSFVYSAICILLSLLADACDGRVARYLKVSGPFGRELDSLADVVSFGVAPAYMMYSYALKSLGIWGYIPMLVFAVLGGFRLARFNIMTVEIKGFFQGLAIPTAGCLCATYILSGIQINENIIAILMLIIAFLMVSEVPYPDFKGKGAVKIQKLSVIIIILLGLLALYININSWPVLPFALYTLFGVINLGLNSIMGVKN